MKKTRANTRFATKLVLLIGLVGGAQATVAFWVWPVRSDELMPAHLLECVRQLDDCIRGGTDVLMFGDSVLAHVHDKDDDRRTIPEILDDVLPQMEVGAVHHPAFQPEVYDAMVRYLTRGVQPGPRVLVVPINMRAFSTGWHMEPRYQFEDLLWYLNFEGWTYRLAYRPLQVFKALAPEVSESEFRALPIYIDGVVDGRVDEFLVDDSRRSRFRFHYRERLHPDHPKLRSLASIARSGRDAGFEVVFYVTPLNLRYGETVDGPGLRATVEANIRSVQAVLATWDQQALDLSAAVPPSFFVSSRTAGEHLNEKGRRFVAREVGAEILRRSGGPRQARADQGG